MVKPELQKHTTEEHETEKEITLKGTFLSVMLLGIFIIISWTGAWLLFLSR